MCIKSLSVDNISPLAPISISNGVKQPPSAMTVTSAYRCGATVWSPILADNLILLHIDSSETTPQAVTQNAIIAIMNVWLLTLCIDRTCLAVVVAVDVVSIVVIIQTALQTTDVDAPIPPPTPSMAPLTTRCHVMLKSVSR